MWDQAIIANPEPNATFFTLDNLNRHNVLEHDASMSRADAYLGNNHVFNQTIFDTTTAFWTEPILDKIQLTNGKLFRQLVSRSENPEYTFTQTTEAFSLGEVGAPVIVFGDHESVTVNRSLITYFFENERLPVELGFVKQAEPISLEAVTRISEILANASNLITPSNATAAHKRRDLHAGLFFSA
ncbi:Chloroperoxidase [Neofusicoccum parvum]|uniref:Chloroperoxidase n=2 Tax=Neofusicoccum parvum TaxID=310453 RepID=A0ACB5SMI7_9PEZI|nr:putative Chloroperoxidase protein [Neofusicoccum parvum UCRNP2]GME33904.1 Chloroperoxidase [Neofusicoccum parvum]GME48626.1 Chloroperoxidase [Neofusicoccum parvum]